MTVTVSNVMPHFSVHGFLPYRLKILDAICATRAILFNPSVLFAAISLPLLL